MFRPIRAEQRWPGVGPRKRGLPCDTDTPPPEKHFITEEEMTAEMQMLQIEEQSRISQCQFLNRAPDMPFMFNAHGQFNGFGCPQNAPTPSLSSPFDTGASSTFSVPPGVMPSTQWPATFPNGSSSQYFTPELTRKASTSESDSDMEPDSYLPRLIVSDEVLKVSPQPALPPSLLNQSPRNMALVPYIPPLLIPQMEDECIDKDEIEMVD